MFTTADRKVVVAGETQKAAASTPTTKKQEMRHLAHTDELMTCVLYTNKEFKYS